MKKALQGTFLGGLALLLALAAGSQTAQAQNTDQTIDPAFRADIERLMEVTGANKIFEQLIAQVATQVSQTLKQQFPNEPRTVAAYDKFMNRIRGLMQENMDEILEPGIQAYARHFTPDEIRQLLAFYDTDLGQKIVRVMPALLSEVVRERMPIIERIMKPAQHELQEDLRKLAEESEQEKTEEPPTRLN